jgi:hypothetical protein
MFLLRPLFSGDFFSQEINQILFSYKLQKNQSICSKKMRTKNKPLVCTLICPLLHPQLHIWHAFWNFSNWDLSEEEHMCQRVRVNCLEVPALTIGAFCCPTKACLTGFRALFIEENRAAAFTMLFILI